MSSKTVLEEEQAPLDSDELGFMEEPLEEENPFLFNEPEMSGLLGQVMSSIMSNYFEYQHSDGTTLNIADILLLMRQSIDKNTEVQLKVLEALSSKR